MGSWVVYNVQGDHHQVSSRDLYKLETLHCCHLSLLTLRSRWRQREYIILNFHSRPLGIRTLLSHTSTEQSSHSFLLLGLGPMRQDCSEQRAISNKFHVHQCQHNTDPNSSVQGQLLTFLVNFMFWYSFLKVKKWQKEGSPLFNPSLSPQIQCRMAQMQVSHR